jgi:hypothetical protein
MHRKARHNQVLFRLQRHLLRYLLRIPVPSTAIRSITLASASDGCWPTANNVVLAVPEPATYGMFLAGLGFLGLMARLPVLRGRVRICAASFR